MKWLTLGIALLSFTAGGRAKKSMMVSFSSTCSASEFQCENGACIPLSEHCNDNKDCTDGSDETGCDYFLCKEPYWYRCKHDGTCISSAMRCDNHRDCTKGDDEENCENFEMPHSPATCSKFEFTCTDKTCVPADLICDGVKHCLDGSDETIGCIDIDKKCKGFLCKNKHCLESSDWVCDGFNDCSDGSDEEHCLSECTVEQGKFECADNSTCIDLAKVCDGHSDCDDHSDEGPKCQSKECDALKCNQGKCQPTPAGAVCVCDAGFRFNGTSRMCEDINECDHYGICSQGCENTNGSFRCTCVEKFVLHKDGRTCELLPGAEALMLYTTQRSVGALYLTSMHQYYVAKDLSQVIGVSYDGQHIYWTDISFKMESIERAQEDGSKRELLLTSGLASPEDLALDWLTGNIYFSDSGYMHIAVCSSDGYHCKVLIQDKLHKPRGIALLPQNGTLFYSDWGDRGMIATASMDGSEHHILVEDEVHWPNGLTLDWPNERIYWVDAKLRKIESIRFDGTHRVTVLSDVLKHPFSIAVFNDRIYWSDWDTKSIQSCNKFTGKSRKTVVHDRMIFDVHIYHSSMQPKSNHPCTGNPCSHLCLLTSNSSYACGCPHGMVLHQDKHSCREMTKRQSLLVGIGSYLVTLNYQAFGRHDEGNGEALHLTISRMAFNTITGELFVADNIQKVIFVVDLGSKSTRRLISSGIGNISALAFDYLGNNLYWTDTDRSTVEVFSMQTHHRSILMHFLGTDQPVALALIPEIGKMFIALRSRTQNSHTHIDRQDMTGTGPHTHIIEERLSGNGSFGFTVDRDLRAVYWYDQGNSRIEMTSYEGDTRHLYRDYLRSPVSMAIVGDELFWTCHQSKRLYWSDKHNIGATKKINLQKPPFGEFPDAIVLQATQPIQHYDHPCLKRNGGCSHICVAAGMYSSSCVCPTGMIFNSVKNTTCIDAIDCEFQCSSGECLTASKRCNGRQDCADGSDEIGCSGSGGGTAKSAPASCGWDEFRCADGSRCIERKLRCDKHSDCADHSDERNCDGYNATTRCHEMQFACSDGMCVDVTGRCDGLSDCADGSDEIGCADRNRQDGDASTCKAGMFRCNSGQCIAGTWECDGQPDCTDGSDEHGKCSSGKDSCRTGFTRCSLGHCIEDRLVCDGNDDCGDGSDEENCRSEAATVCPGADLEHPTSFYCTRSKKCLEVAVRCNGTTECPDGEDETDCSSCGLHEFQCKSGRCISAEWRCDKDVDCDDGSDEADCQNGTARAVDHFRKACDEGTFECQAGECIDMSKVCDDHADCSNGHDEGQGCANACPGGKGPCEQRCQKTPDGPVCSCKDGFALSGDRKTCLDIDECHSEEPCAQVCTNTHGSYRCSCHPGFMLRSDKMSCKAVGPSRYVLYTSFNQIRKLEVNPPVIQVLLETNYSRITAMDVDIRRGKLYFTAEDSGAIYEHDLRTNATIVLPSIGEPERLAVDWITGSVYFYDKTESSIKVCNVERKACARLITFKPQDFVKALAVDPINRYVFFSLMHFWILEVPHSIIYRAKLDGSHQEVVTKDVGYVSAIECDPHNQRLYFTDMTTRMLRSIDYVGHNARILVRDQQQAIGKPIGLSLYENEAYVLNMASSSVGQCQLYAERRCKVLELNVHTSKQLLVVQESRQPLVHNQCDPHLINCSLLCVPAEHGGKCICHNGEHIREGDQCPYASDSGLAINPVNNLLGRSSSDTNIESSGQDDSHGTSSFLASFINFTLVVMLLAAAVSSAYYLYRKRFNHKFDVGMHFHNPELCTLNAAEVKMFQQREQQRLPPQHQIVSTATHNELVLALDEVTSSGGQAASAASRDDTYSCTDSYDVATTTAIELGRISDTDSMKDVFLSHDDPQQRLIS